MSALYDCWLRYNTNIDRLDKEMLKANLASVSVENGDDITASAVEEIGRFCKAVGLEEPKLVESGVWFPDLPPLATRTDMSLKKVATVSWFVVTVPPAFFTAYSVCFKIWHPGKVPKNAAKWIIRATPSA